MDSAKVAWESWHKVALSGNKGAESATLWLDSQATLDSALVIEHWNQSLPKPQNEDHWRLAEIHFKTITI